MPHDANSPHFFGLEVLMCLGCVTSLLWPAGPELCSWLCCNGCPLSWFYSYLRLKRSGKLGIQPMTQEPFDLLKLIQGARVKEATFRGY